jgi:HAE1 family hydrophobic/amphiphilic exporter-1
MIDTPAQPPVEPQPQKHYRLAIRRPVTMAMLFLTLLVFGWRSYQQLPINLMPDISYPTLTVRTEYEGAAPEDVEKLVTRPLEEMLSIVSGMKEISSISSPGLSEIILEFAWGTDMVLAMQDVRDRLDLFEAPKEVTEKPVILRYDPTLDPVIRVALAPSESESFANKEEEQAALTAVREAAERYLKSDLEAEPGIAQVVVKGGREEEIQVLVDSERVKNLGLSVQAVAQSLAQQNINLSGGRLQEGKTEYLVRTLNEFLTVEDIQDSIISTPAGQPIKLSDVADIFLGKKEREAIIHINGQEAVELEIFKEGDANTVYVCNRVKDLLGFPREISFGEQVSRKIAIGQIRSQAEAEGRVMSFEEAERRLEERERANTYLDRLPDEVDTVIISDQSQFIQGSIDEVQQSTIIGGILALLVLFIFLREMRSTIIIGVAIPISVIAAFVPMYMRDISLNIMSLGGLALGVGMLVDNSIVVLESIFRCKEEGDDIMDAAERGTGEVASAVTSSTMTTIAVFFPITFVEGIAGQLFGDLALTVTFSLLASLLSALYLIPMIASRRSVVLAADREVVWMVRAYREARAEGTSSRIAAALGIVPRAFRYSGEYLRESARDLFGPTISVLRFEEDRGRVKALLAFIVALLLLPFLLVLYPVQIALRLVGAILVAVLFIVCLLILGIYLALRAVLIVIMWLPLWLFDRGYGAFTYAYRGVLTQALRVGPLLLLIAIALAVHAGYLAMDLGQELIPPMQQGEFGVRMEAPPGTRLEDTEALAQRIEAVIRRRPDVETVTVEVGSEDDRAQSNRGENIAQFNVRLRNPDETTPFQQEIMEELRREIRQVSAEEINFTLPALFSFKTAVELQIYGDNLQELKEIGEASLAALTGRLAGTEPVQGLKDAELSVTSGYPEIIIELDRELLASMGLSPGVVAERLRREVQGEVPTRFSRSGEKIDIRVRTDQARLQSEQDLRRLSISDGNPPIPLEAVADIRVQKGPSEIRRIGQRQVVLITGNVEGVDLAAVSKEIDAAMKRVEMPAEYFYTLGGQNRELEVSYQSLRFALLLAIFLVYVVMACQFESIWHPALVMFSVPLALIGVVYVLVWQQIDLSIMVFLGGIVLAGIVVNNAIVLVDYVNQLRARGMRKRAAVIEAGTVRLRPILMTTITTVLGLLPMALASGEGSELRQPMAITVMAGLTSATLLTLLIIPIVYDIFGGRDKT